MPEKKKKNSPFAINFRRLQRYNAKVFGLEEIVFFEYLMILSQAFGYKEFYHSANMICRDIGLKRTRLERVINKMQQMGILTVEVKGFPKIMHFTMHITTIMELLPTIYQSDETSTSFDEICKLFDDINKRYAETNTEEKLRRNYNKETNKKTAVAEIDSDPENGIRPEILSAPMLFVSSLEYLYNTRRKLKNYESDLYADREKYVDDVSLGYKTQKIYLLVHEAMSSIATDQIENAWTVYADKIMTGELNPARVLPYFFSKRCGEFDVIHALADVYNTTYTQDD